MRGSDYIMSQNLEAAVEILAEMGRPQKFTAKKVNHIFNPLRFRA
jgi:hypothetical protein